MNKKLIIKEIRTETEGFKIFTFEDNAAINYKAGQYLTLLHYANNQEIRRSYSIISSPVLNESLAIGVKRIENGFFSRLLVDRAQPGDILYTTGAGGFFILPDNVSDYRQLFFFAAGSGITPVFALLKSILYGYPDISVVLIYSNTSISNTIFLNELKELQEKFGQRFILEFLFSDSTDLNRARLHRDLLMKLVASLLAVHLNATLFYICGPVSYMRMCTFVLQEMGVERNNIRRENFVIQKPAHLTIQPPDKESHKATIYWEEERYEFDVVYPETILSAARRQNIILPYSCEAGRCGNCVARCVTGKVWLSYNEVLTEKELAKGLTLTCVGHPVEGDVVLNIG